MNLTVEEMEYLIHRGLILPIYEEWSVPILMPPYHRMRSYTTPVQLSLRSKGFIDDLGEVTTRGYAALSALVDTFGFRRGAIDTGRPARRTPEGVLILRTDGLPQGRPDGSTSKIPAEVEDKSKEEIGVEDEGHIG